jgi:hypothetical protein
MGRGSTWTVGGRLAEGWRVDVGSSVRHESARRSPIRSLFPLPSLPPHERMKLETEDRPPLAQIRMFRAPELSLHERGLLVFTAHE